MVDVDEHIDLDKMNLTASNSFHHLLHPLPGAFLVMMFCFDVFLMEILVLSQIV